VKLQLNREGSVNGATIGTLYADARRLCYTLEDEVREVPGVQVGLWKVHGRTAIPAGEYAITLEDSPRFGPGTLTVNNVPGFIGVRMHAGNTAEDTDGCPLLGLEVADGTIVGGTSRPAVTLVQNVVRAALARGEHVQLTITNAGTVI